MINTRYIIPLKKLCKKYYDIIELNITNYFRNKIYISTDHENKNINHIFNINENYTFDNYCSHCLNPQKNDIFIELDCGHQMHYYCFKEFIVSNYEHCPFCKENINIKNIKDKMIIVEDLNDENKNNINTINLKKLDEYNINEIYYK